MILLLSVLQNYATIILFEYNDTVAIIPIEYPCNMVIKYFEILSVCNR